METWIKAKRCMLVKLHFFKGPKTVISGLAILNQHPSTWQDSLLAASTADDTFSSLRAPIDLFRPTFPKRLSIAKGVHTVRMV